ncbi:hypothetical protein [Tardiphaga sp.]|uniref:hypothetical protein n=1 Tax=Tardiphaga sp. TaxID=1926292 RepID=UPI00260A31C6|nr:hypothetical protein [Tardiphaga sp.]MDB5620853.1 hypothetical protein [Tardiphaga sp.]
MGQELTIVAQPLKEYVLPYGAYSPALSRSSRTEEAVQARKAYARPNDSEPRELDMRA